MRIVHNPTTSPPQAASTISSRAGVKGRRMDTEQQIAKLLAAAGFAIDSETNRRGFALEIWREIQDNIARHGPPPLNAQLLAGSASKERIANVIATLHKGTIAPVEMIARAV